MQSPRHFFSFFPQFHPDPINDRAWGPGFTDWDLIRDLPEVARSAFTPAIGHYDPSSVDYLPQLQQQLAALPLHDPGLMLYHYYFDGQHALSKFEQHLLERPSATSFFFCWANETWTKRWVGRPNDIIVEQKHRNDRGTIEQHASYLSRFFELPNYHRVGSRPLFVIYNPQASANLPQVLSLYREAFASLGQRPLIGCCISYPQHPTQMEAYDFGCEFEPRFFFNTRSSSSLLRAASRGKARFPRLFEWLGAKRDRLRESGGNRDFPYARYLNALRSGELERELRASVGALPLLRSTFLSWDNTPRYRQHSTRVSHAGVLADNLDVLSGLHSDEGLPVLVNSWNEWSEGAALEPGLQQHPLREAFLRSLATAVTNRSGSQ